MTPVSGSPSPPRGSGEPGLDFPLLLRPDNLVARPWGGCRIASFKGLDLGGSPGQRPPVGESFEISADPGDPEAATHPSRVVFPDGSERLLTDLLAERGPEILGEEVYAAVGPRFPLLPKLLDVRELLSVQAHPPGHPELYVVVDAEPGATLRLGWRRFQDPQELRRRLQQGLAAQTELSDSLRPEADRAALHRALAGELADVSVPLSDLVDRLGPWWRSSTAAANRSSILGLLRDVVRDVLDRLHAIPVHPDDVILNAQPGESPLSASIHALGNPERRGILLLEIRRPGPTFRAWDHGRLPLRPLHLDEALATVSLKASRPQKFRVDVGDDAVRQRLATTPWFVVDRIRLEEGESVASEPGEGPHSLHAIEGGLTVLAEGNPAGIGLPQGRSCLVPASSRGYSLSSTTGRSRVVRVALPSPYGLP